MEQAPHTGRNKGGRPRKAERRDQLIAVKCSVAERRIIQQKAMSVRLSVSEFLREIALNGKVVSHKRSIPAEVLALTGSLNSNGALLNQIAKARNNMESLTIKQQAELFFLAKDLQMLAADIKKYLSGDR